MARIPDDEIERLKREADLAGLVRLSGVELAPHGAGGDLIGRCPLHDDRTPSLVVRKKKGHSPIDPRKKKGHSPIDPLAAGG